MSGFFVEARPVVGARAFLTVGARLERIERRALERDPSAFNDRPAFDDEVVWSLNPKLSAAWWIRPPDANGWTKLRGSVGTGIKPPTGFEIAYTNNPDLKPERNRSFDVGIEQALAGTALVAEANWFSNRYDDLIASVGSSFAGPNPFRTDNIANASARGLEAGARWRGRRGLGARTAWTFQHTEVLGLDPAPNIAPEPYRVGNPLVRRPAVQGFGELSWTTARGNGFVSVGGRGEVTDLEPNYGSSIFTNPGYATVAFGGAITIRRQFNVFVRVDNAFDRQYEEVLGYPALGRTALVGIRVAAGR
jgi:outer membrane receptor protein involved in Fe transport